MSAGGGGGAHEALKIILIALFVIFLGWFFLGGKDRAENTDEPFIAPAAPLDSGEEFGIAKKGQAQLPVVHAW